MKYIEGGVTAAKGFSAGGMYCGIRKNKSKPDLAMIYSSAPCAAAGMYTSNLVKGAPILVTKRNLENGTAHAVICNSGNANTCNADGEEKAWSMCEIAGKALHIDPHDVIVASTGVIGQVLPIEPIADTAPLLAASLSGDGSSQAARAIMTTDTVVKEAAAELEIGGKTVRLGGICKGSGMIHPNMCTMLCFLTTDAAVSAPVLDKALRAVVADTFNMVSIDGDTSTNDTITIMANGLAENPEIQADTAEYEAFQEALRGICTNLARKMAKDGEGATKLLVCKASGAADLDSARKVAKSVICSSLLKAAMFGADANWGRVLCAIGYAGTDTDISKVDVSFRSAAGTIGVCRNGSGIPFSEEEAKKILSEDEIDILVSLGDGTSSAEAYGCDLTYEYVKINGDYRT